MSRRSKVITIFVLLIIAILLLLFFLFRARPQVAPEVITTESETEEEVPSLFVPPPPPQIKREERLSAAPLQSVAKTFIERYGSFSNEAEYANLRDILPLMTSDFAAETQRIIEAASPSEGFYAVTTRVITVSVDELDEDAGSARMTLTTQREEAIDGPQNISVKFQTMVLTFRKEQGEWKVASAEWR